MMAVEYWKMAASQEFPLSLLNLGKLYLEGSPDVQPDLEQSKTFLERVSLCESEYKPVALELLEQVENAKKKTKKKSLFDLFRFNKVQ